MKRLAKLTSVALATLLVVAALWQFRAVVTLFILSLAVAAALRPMVERQVSRGWPRGVSLVLVYVLVLALAFALLWSVGPALLAEVRMLLDQAAVGYEVVWVSWPTGTTFQQMVAPWLPSPTDLYDAITGPRGEAMLQNLLGVTTNLFEIVGRLAIVLVLSLYWSIDQARFERLWLTVLPAEGRVRARKVWRTIEVGVGAYIRSQLVQALLAGLLLGVAFTLLGAPYNVLLALLAAIAWMIPWLGAVLGVVVVLLMGSATTVPLVALAGAAFTALVYALLGLVVEPRLYNRHQYSSVLVVVVLMSLGETFGLLGLLAAPAVAAALQIFFGYVLSPAASAAARQPQPQLRALEQRLDAMRAAIEASHEPPAAQVLSMVERLEALMARAAEDLPGTPLPIREQPMAERPPREHW